MKLNKFIFTIFMILLMPFSLYAVPSDTVSVSLDTASGIPGDILTIPVKVVNTTGLKVISFEVEITYNNTFLDTAGIDTTGTLSSLYDGNFYSNIVSPGLYRIVAT